MCRGKSDDFKNKGITKKKLERLEPDDFNGKDWNEWDDSLQNILKNSMRMGRT